MIDLEMPNFDLPTVRIKRLVLNNFKSVKHGEIVFNCGRSFVPEDTISDVMGIYGQNGSGKTAVVEALAILKASMSGEQVPLDYADCISIDSDQADLSFTFDLQYPNGIVREVSYGFSLTKTITTKEEVVERMHFAPDITISKRIDDILGSYSHKIVISNERINMKWENSSKTQVIINTDSEESLFYPDSKRKQLLGNSKEIMYYLMAEKDNRRDASMSFVFSAKFINAVKMNCKDLVFYDVLFSLSFFADKYLHVVDTRMAGLIRINLDFPIITRLGILTIPMGKPKTLPEPVYDYLNNAVERQGDVLNEIVPGLSLSFKLIERTFDSNGAPAVTAMLMSKRNGKEIPLKEESDGVRKIVSILNLLVTVFNQKSTTVVIDEFDEGIFEYLLGEIVQVIAENGKGQFIFTSHNLRPLEVLDKRYLCFTTTNPNNRYIRLKGISETNNLRDTYFREILLNEQDESIYNRTKRIKMVAAFKRAGVDEDE